MGSMAEPLKREYVQRYGQNRWDEHIEAINSMWQGIRQKVFDLRLDYGKTRVYQDGLAICQKELAIANELALAGNENYGIIVELIQRGATLMGTENPRLLIEEYNYIKAISETVDLSEKDKLINKYEIKAGELLHDRDEFIAGRINETLLEGETGILFMGMKHRVEEILPKDIEVSHLIYRLPFKESHKY